MAQEIKNSFLKSKMNKDLDDRILPNGEYRDARNISVGRSEDSDVGALENIIGNDLVTGTDIGSGLTVIGILNDNSNDKLFLFLTDYLDPDSKNPTNAPSTSKHYIYSYDNISGDYNLLVQGEFLNFSKTNPIIGINLLENLLFWTDNRNQPRKINVNLAVAFEAGSIAAGEDYYRSEHQISVAKYNPYQAIELYNRADLQVLAGATTTILEVSGNREQELLPFVGATVVCAEATTPTFGTDYVKVESVTVISTSGPTRITVSPALNSAPTVGQYVSLIKSTMSNKNSDNTWPGDPDYLEDKFVRFSYRFKFDDNEYSLMAPFTQIAYIPKQNGYFIDGDEDAAYQSTIVGFMENLVQNIGLVIPLPCSANDLVSDYKISELEILFRESDSITVKVLDSVAAGDISGEVGVNNYYTYEYQSRKPYRTLPEAQTVRVYDKVPVRALAQESSGNRIIYGNFRDKHTPPDTINYNCKIGDKSTSGAYNNFVEYPNHSVKRNRNYQIGFVLADKFGRQSPVILSSVDEGAESSGQFYSGSTIYSPYDLTATDTDVDTWFGDAIQVLVNEPVASEIDSASGTPGLYAIKQQEASTGEGFAVAAGFVGTPPSISGNVYTFTLDSTAFPNNVNIPIDTANNYLRGAYTDFVKVTNVVNTSGTIYEVTTDGPISDVYLRTDNLPSGDPDLKFAYTINDLGWYSYKIVVKQTEQEYYNVYLPGILNGYPGQSEVGMDNGPFPGDETNLTAHTVLFNDNINKVPRDLAEVGPDQKQFRSSVTLYGRVSNIMIADATGSNEQYYPRLISTGKNAIDHTATTIATAEDLDMRYNQLSDDSGTNPRNGNLVYYQIDTNPLIARISTTEKSIGATNINTASTGIPYNMVPFLAVYETAPFESNLDLYWETTSEGLIVDLNADIASSNSGVVGFENINWEFLESDGAGTNVTGFFTPINNEGQTYATAPTGQLISAVDGLNINVGFFELETGTIGTVNEGKFRINYTGQGLVFNSSSAIRDVYTFVIKMTTSDGDISQITLAGEPGGFGALQNVVPSFNSVGNITKTKDDRTIIPAATFATAANGTILTGALKKEGLVFRFDPLPGDDIPDNWNMDPNSGALTQSIPGDVVGTSRNFSGNGLGIYNIRIKVSDASDSDTNNTTLPYQSLVAFEDISIRIAYSTANSEALSTTCVITPVATNPNGLTSVLSVNNPVSSFNFTSMMYYISKNAIDTSVNGNEFFNNGIPPTSRTNNLYYNRVGTGAHRRGTLVFTSNLYVPWNGVDSQNSVTVPVTTFYYRFVGDAQWLPLPRSVEENKAGSNNIITSPSSINMNNLEVQSFDSPDISNPTATFNFNLLFDYGPNPMWEQTVRAIDYNSLTNTEEIEYAVLMEGLSQQFGASTIFNTAKSWLQVDDLHYPTCVPWKGTNAVTANGGPGNYFKYFRSAGGSNSTEYVDISASTDEIFAETPYGDYVNQFYTSATNNVPFIPTSASLQYLNVKLDRSGIGLDQWTTYNGALTTQPPTTPIDLQWVAGYSNTDGFKIINSLVPAGVSAVQVSNDQSFLTTQGTLRISKN